MTPSGKLQPVLVQMQSLPVASLFWGEMLGFGALIMPAARGVVLLPCPCCSTAS